jgi:hypothetical protein
VLFVFPYSQIQNVGKSVKLATADGKVVPAVQALGNKAFTVPLEIPGPS